ncbi:hypothetical protein [Ascidiimonas aurantiaca]|uniref:hypothetical protein n=1 Tax=Ascidiimonas aurantiaca TaxID=1685432 RepID=UPI0030EB8977
MDLNSRQLSFIITFLIMSIVTLTVFNIQMSGMQEPEYLFEMVVDEKLEEELKLLDEQTQQQDIAKTHMAYNEAVKSRFDKELETFKTLDELREEAKNNDARDKSSDDSKSNNSEEDVTNNENDRYLTSSGNTGMEAKAEKKERAEASRGDDTSKDLKKSNVFRRNTTISYSLKDRMHLKLANPIYTCEENGKIVINIKVDASGNVTEAYFNKASSTSTNGCLIDNAIAYALRSKFESGSTPQQLGSITYLFQNH